MSLSFAARQTALGSGVYKALHAKTMFRRILMPLLGDIFPN